MGALPAPQASPLAKQAQKIKAEVDTLISKMNKDPKFTPSREELGKCAQKIVHYINQNHEQTAPHESYLKAAIIDLTEVPVMAPQMQRISFAVALKDASHEIELYLSCL